MSGIDSYSALSGLDGSVTKPKGVAPGYMDFAPLGLYSETGKSCIDCALLGRDYEMKEDETQ